MSSKVRWKFTFFCFLVVVPLAGAAACPARAARLGDIPVMVEFAAGMRATAAMDPDEKIRNPDTMARQFLSPSFWFWSALDEDYEKCKTFIKFYRVGAYYTANAFTKHIDGILKNAGANGLEQVVILGAGLDSRGYRFRNSLPKVTFFEVDLPAAVARKKELVIAAVGELPTTVVYVPVDYRSEKIDGALRRAGYDRKRSTLFICEQVTRYIEATAVDGIMSFIAANAAPGSQLVFDYIPEDIVKGDFTVYPWARLQSVRMAAYGYPWKFGIAPDKAAKFSIDRGFSVISDLGAKDLAQRYLVRSDGSIDGQPTPFVRIIHVAVKK